MAKGTQARSTLRRKRLLEVHAATTLPQFWRATCALLRAEMPVHEFHLAVSSQGGPMSMCFSDFKGYSPEDWQAAFESGLGQLESAFPGRLSFRLTDFLPAELKNAAEVDYRMSHLTKSRGFFAAALAFWRGKDFAHLLSITRRLEQGDFSDRELHRLEQYHADLETALRRVLHCERLHAEINALGSSLRGERIAVAVLGWNLRPSLVNPEAIEAGRRWHREKGPAGPLKRSALPTLPPQLEEACRNLRTELTKQGRNNLKLIARPLCRRLRLNEEGAPAAELLYLKPRSAPVESGRFIVRYAATAGLGGPQAAVTGLDRLTLGEQSVTELVGAGKSNDQAAARLSLSVHTVRSHLRSVFRKLGVQSRAELAARLHAKRPSATKRGADTSG